MTRRFPVGAVMLSLIAMMLPLANAGVGELDQDVDGDGVVSRFDNCYLFSNPLQGDADNDGFGNRCDTDLDNDLDVDFEDLVLFSESFSTDNAVADFNEDGVVNFLDLVIFKNRFASGRPGPAIIVRWAGGSGRWNHPENWFPSQLPNSLSTHAEINAENDQVIVEAFESAFAKSLVVDGHLSVCGTFGVTESLAVNGRFSVVCPDATALASSGIDLNGELTLEEGVLFTTVIRKTPAASGSVTVTGDGSAGLGGVDLLNDVVETEIDISVLPGATLAVFSEITLSDANLTITSNGTEAARLVLNGDAALSGAGDVLLAGPKSDTVISQIDAEVAHIGPGITVSVAPDSFGYLKAGIVNRGHIRADQSSTLFFKQFDVTTNTGLVSCQGNSQILEFDPGTPSPGDSILFNNEGGTVSIENCVTDWPTRIINQGEFTVSHSELVFPLIGLLGAPIDILSSDITIESIQQPLPQDFYLFDPVRENTVLHEGALGFGIPQTELVIDAAKWRFTPTDGDAIGSIFNFGTIVSETPFTINSGARVSFVNLTADTEVHIETGAYLKTIATTLAKNVSFVEAPDCNPSTTTPGVLEFGAGSPMVADDITISAEAELPLNGDGCLRAELYSPAPTTLPENVTITVSQADLRIYTDPTGTFDLRGITTVSGSNAKLELQEVTNTGVLSCENGAEIKAFGTDFLRTFTNSGLITAADCSVVFSQYWRNDGNVTLTRGSLDLAGPTSSDFGSGNFLSELTDITFDVLIEDTTVLNVFKPIPPGGSFTYLGSLEFIGPVLNTSDLPFNTQFVDGFALFDKTIFGAQPLRLNGDATLTNIQTSADIEVGNNALVTLTAPFELDSADLVVHAQGDEATSVLIDNAADVGINGSGNLVFKGLGSDAVAGLFGIASNPIFISPDIDVQCSGSGRCIFSAGFGRVSIAGNLTVSDTGTRYEAASDTDLMGTTTLLDRSQILFDGSVLSFLGEDAELAIEVFSDTGTQASVVADGVQDASVILGGSTALSFIEGDGLSADDGLSVFVLEHPGNAERVFEFADITNAVLGGVLLDADYSSPDVTVFTLSLAPSSPVNEAPPSHR